MITEELPSFEKPPVVETVLGVQFIPLPKFRNAHLGAFWKHLNSDRRKLLSGDWTDLVDAATLEPAFERFGEEKAWAPLGPSLKLTSDPSARIQIRNTSGDAMVQLQNGRLYYNWLGKDGGDYPRYKYVRPRFDELLEGLRQFLRNEGLGEIEPDQWEITYVNHLPKGTVWNQAEDWANLFVGLPGPWCAPSSVRLESFGGSWHFEIEPQRGRLHVEARHARAGSAEGHEILRLTLTARGPVSENPDEGLTLDEGLKLGRTVIVKTFNDITSSEAHKYWGPRK